VIGDCGHLSLHIEIFCISIVMVFVWGTYLKFFQITLPSVCTTLGTPLAKTAVSLRNGEVITPSQANINFDSDSPSNSSDVV
jgi:hypothetical protein